MGDVSSFVDSGGVVVCCGFSISLAPKLILPLEIGVAKMELNPDKYREYDSQNGWGTYEDFVPWVEKYIAACKKYPDAKINISK